MPGIYRQTTEISGMYGPLKTYIAEQMVPPKKCATTKKISPSHPIAKHKNPKRFDHDQFVDEESYSQYYAAVHSQPLVRPYTPPEKRYSASFGRRLPERKYNVGSDRYFYENVDVERDFCVGDECYANQVRNEQRNTQNVRVKNCPLPEFNQMYIQESFE